VQFARDLAPAEPCTELVRFGVELMPRLVWSERLRSALNVDSRPDGCAEDYLALLQYDRALAQRLIEQVRLIQKAESSVSLAAAIPLLGMRYVRDALVFAELSRGVGVTIPRELVFARLGEERAGASGYAAGVFWEKLILAASDLAVEARVLKHIAESARSALNSLAPMSPSASASHSSGRSLGQIIAQGTATLGEAILEVLIPSAIELHVSFESKRLPQFVRMFVEDLRLGMCAQSLLIEAWECSGMLRGAEFAAAFPQAKKWSELRASCVRPHA
jgi:hypothetical protein